MSPKESSIQDLMVFLQIREDSGEVVKSTPHLYIVQLTT